MTENVQITLPLLEKTYSQRDWQALKEYLLNKEKSKKDLIDHYSKELLKKHLK